MNEVKSTSPYVVHPSDLKVSDRIDGISGVIRAKNEELTIGAAIESFLPALDELVVVHNDCQDQTAQICESYRQRYPDKLKVFHYEPKVVPSRSKEYQKRHIPDDSEESFANYNNFAYCKTTRKIAVKVDAHCIALPEQWQRICDLVRQDMSRYDCWAGKIITVAPISQETDENRLGLTVHNVQSTSNWDAPFFFVSEDTWYYYDVKAGSEGFELMDTSSLTGSRRNLGIYAMHIKTLKPLIATKRSYEYKDKTNAGYVMAGVHDFYRIYGILTLRQLRILLFREFFKVGLYLRVEAYCDRILKRYGFEFSFYRQSIVKDLLAISRLCREYRRIGLHSSIRDLAVRFADPLKCMFKRR